MRISLHHGPIFEHFDAVQGARTFYGTEVTLAARIEPRVPVGAIYTTQPFAAMIDSDRTDYHFEYVGKMDLAKNYGVRILYRLSAGQRTSARLQFRQHDGMPSRKRTFAGSLSSSL